MQVQFDAELSAWPEGSGAGEFSNAGSAALDLKDNLALASLLVLASDLSPRLGKPMASACLAL